jgi:hypothetical protein
MFQSDYRDYKPGSATKLSDSPHESHIRQASTPLHLWIPWPVWCVFADLGVFASGKSLPLTFLCMQFCEKGRGQVVQSRPELGLAPQASLAPWVICRALSPRLPQPTLWANTSLVHPGAREVSGGERPEGPPGAEGAGCWDAEAEPGAICEVRQPCR